MNAIPPPTSSRSTLPRSDSISASFSETFAPPRIATSGCAGASKICGEGGKLLLHEEPRHRRPEVSRDAFRRGVGPVGGGKGVVDVDVAEPRERLGERGVVRFLALVKPEVLEEQHTARRQGAGLALDGRSDAVRREGDGLPEERREAPRDRGQGELRLGAAFRPAEMRGQHHRTHPARPRVADRGERRPDPCVLAHLAVAPERDVEVDADEHPAVRRSRSSIVRLDMAGGRERPTGPGRSGVRSLPAPPHEGDQIADAARVAPLVVVPGEHLHE